MADWQDFFHARLVNGHYVRIRSWHPNGYSLSDVAIRRLIEHLEFLAAPPPPPTRVMYPEDIGL